MPALNFSFRHVRNTKQAFDSTAWNYRTEHEFAQQVHRTADVTMESTMPGRYPDVEDRDEQMIANPGAVVIDMQAFRRTGKIVEYDARANQPPRPMGSNGACDEPEE